MRQRRVLRSFSMGKSKTKVAVLVYLCGMVAIHAGLFWQARELIRKGYPDFTIYYCAGTMVRRGWGHELYNSAAQFKVQQEFAPDVAIRLDALPYNHPSFEALFFVPFTYFSYLPAFVLWDLVNVVALIAIPFLVRGHVPELQRYPWPLWILASLAFFPIFFTLLQGQDSIMLLLFYTLAFVCLKKNAEALAGGCLALGLFKPHLVLPFVFLWLMRSGKKILYGFLPAAAALGLVSLATVGTTGLMSYPSYVLRLERTMARGAIVPSDMPNLRGVIYVLAHDRFYSAGVAIVLSCGILLLAAWQCRSRESAPALFCWKFSLAIVTTIVISYHCLGYDLSMLFLPIALITAKLQDPGILRGWPRVLVLSGVTLLFFSPLQLFVLLRGNHLAVIGWAVILLLSGIAGQIWWETRCADPSSTRRGSFLGGNGDRKSELGTGTIV
jgi:hypothetical protein